MSYGARRSWAIEKRREKLNNAPVTINDLVVYPSNPSVHGEFEQVGNQAQLDRVTRMTAEIKRLSEFAVANHANTLGDCYITRISTPEFFFYTNPPLTSDEYATLIQNIETMASNLPQDIHLILGSFHLKHASGVLLNSTIHVQTGSQPEINSFTKSTFAPGDPASDPVHAFNQNPVRHLGKQPTPELEKEQDEAVFDFTPKAFTALADGDVISNFPLVKCITSSGVEFTTAIDICMDHSMAHTKKILMDSMANQNNPPPMQCSHVIISSSIYAQGRAKITKEGIVHHVDANPTRKGLLDERNLKKFNNSIPINIPGSSSQSDRRGLHIQKPEFGSGYNITRYPPDRLPKLDPEFLYQQAVINLVKTINEYKKSTNILCQELSTQGQRVLAAVQENKPYVKDATLPELTEILNKTNAGIKDPLSTMDEYAQLTNKVIYRKPSIPKVIGGVMLGLLGVIGFAAGIALTASGFGIPIGIPLKIASAVAVKMGAIAVGAGLGMSITSFASLFKRNNKRNIHKEVQLFHNKMQKIKNPPRNACVFQSTQQERKPERNQTDEVLPSTS